MIVKVNENFKIHNGTFIEINEHVLVHFLLVKSYRIFYSGTTETDTSSSFDAQRLSHDISNLDKMDFDGHINLKLIKVNIKNHAFTSIGGVFYKKDIQMLIRYSPEKKKNAKMTI